jgi:hypothetical protein
VRGWTHQAICHLWKELWFHGCLGVEPRRVEIALVEGLCDLEGRNHFGWRPPWLGVDVQCPFIYLASDLQLRGIMERLSQGSRLVLETSCCLDLAVFLGEVSTGLLSLLPAVEFSSSPDWRKCLPGCRTKGFLASADVTDSCFWHAFYMPSSQWTARTRCTHRPKGADL